ncbi:MAG TPA: hypothetical protein VGO47_13840, partial [Chlamydiales bacterium]|nr:hypothetical protein [Chlamydiales bacterium]
MASPSNVSQLDSVSVSVKPPHEAYQDDFLALRLERENAKLQKRLAELEYEIAVGKKNRIRSEVPVIGTRIQDIKIPRPQGMAGRGEFSLQKEMGLEDNGDLYYEVRVHLCSHVSVYEIAQLLFQTNVAAAMYEYGLTS